MSNFIRFDRKDINTIIAMVDELEPEERRPEETAVYHKSCQILELMVSGEEKERPTLYRDPETGRLTIQYGKNVSEPVPYNGIAKLANYFAVTDFYEGIFPTNVLLRFTHANPADREQWLASQQETKAAKASAIKKPRWKRSADE